MRDLVPIAQEVHWPYYYFLILFLFSGAHPCPWGNLSFGKESLAASLLSRVALIAQYVMEPPLPFGTIGGLRDVHPWIFGHVILRPHTISGGIARDLAHLMNTVPFNLDPKASKYVDRPNNHNNGEGDSKRWCLTPNDNFSIKSFYGGLRCQINHLLWRSACPLKIDLLNWLAWRNKILALDNLARRRCNKLPTTTCVIYHSAIESIDHSFLQCPLAEHFWVHFGHLLPLPPLLSSLNGLWRDWRMSIRPAMLKIRDLLTKAITWNIWLKRNERIFNSKSLHVHSICVKIDHMILFWLCAVP